MAEENLEHILEIQKTWKKIETTSRKAGLRDGISEGRDSSFQEFFDLGFKEGFKNGYALGKFKGLLTAHSKQNLLEIEENPFLQETRRGGCEICKNKELLEDDVPMIIEKQTGASNQNLKELHSVFKETVGCDLPDSSDNT